MHNIEIYFVGGTSVAWTEVPQETTDNMVKWLDNKEDTKTFQVNFTKHNKTTLLRKELILFINVV
jgi:hypothetical protein